MFASIAKKLWSWRRIGCELVAVGTAITLFVIICSKLVGGHNWITNDHQPVFGDFVAFWSAGKAVLAGHAAEVHNPTLIHHIHLTIMPGITVVAPWNSPPQFLLIATVLGLMPYPAAALSFLFASATLYFVAARKLLPDARALIFAATAPAVIYELGSIQTGIVIAGVYGLALAWQDRRPIAAGSLIGLLCIKPHFAILWPFYLAITRRWRMFAAAAASAGIFTLAGGLAFGFDSYIRFLNNLAYTQNLITNLRVSIATFGSIYGNLLALHFPHWVAVTAQSISAVLALILTVIVWLRGDPREQGAALCAMAMLVTPYMFFYDTTVLAVAAALLGAPRNKLEMLAVTLGWVAGLSVGIAFVIQDLNHRFGLHMPAYLPIVSTSAWLLLICAARRGALSFKVSELFAKRPKNTEPVLSKSEQSSPPATA